MGADKTLKTARFIPARAWRLRDDSRLHNPNQRFKP